MSEDMTLGERIARHPSLRMQKVAIGTAPDKDSSRHIWRHWTIRFWLMSTEEGEPAWIDQDTPYFETPYSNHESCPADGSDITIQDVLQSVLDNVRDYEDYPTYDEYAAEYQPDKLDSRAAEAEWRHDREITAEASQFFHEVELHGGDSFDAWTRETSSDDSTELEEFTCWRCGDVFIDGDIFNQHLNAPHSSAG